jgi:hypothetical protein
MKHCKVVFIVALHKLAIICFNSSLFIACLFNPNLPLFIKKFRRVLCVYVYKRACVTKPQSLSSNLLEVIFVNCTFVYKQFFYTSLLRFDPANPEFALDCTNYETSITCNVTVCVCATAIYTTVWFMTAHNYGRILYKCQYINIHCL